MQQQALRVKINKLKWRSKRSMLELDLYLVKFIEADGLEHLSDGELTSYEELLKLDDDILLGLFNQTNEVKDINLQNMITKIRQVKELKLL